MVLGQVYIFLKANHDAWGLDKIIETLRHVENITSSYAICLFYMIKDVQSTI